MLERDHILKSEGLRLPGGFTLVEILLSLSIFSLLLALAMPALQHTRARSWEMVCGSHLHQIGIGLSNFSGERFDKLPREGLPRASRGKYAKDGEFLPWPEAILPYLGTGEALASPIYQDPAHPNPNHFVHYVMNGISFRVDKNGAVLGYSGNRRGVWNAATVQRPSEIIYLTSFTDDRDNSIARQVHSWNPWQAQAVFDVWLEVHLSGPDTGSNRNATNVRRIAWNRHGERNNVLHFDMHVSKMGKDGILDLENWYDGVRRTGPDPQSPWGGWFRLSDEGVGRLR